MNAVRSAQPTLSMQHPSAFTLGVLPESEKVLEQHPKLLGWLTKMSNKRSQKFASLMDQIVCRLFTRYAVFCRQFYGGKAPCLGQLLSLSETSVLDFKLKTVLELTAHGLAQGKKIGWSGMHATMMLAELKGLAKSTPVSEEQENPKKKRHLWVVRS